MQETVETTTVSRRLSSELVVECRSRSTSALIERVLLDEGVGLRDVGLGLVVVVVADEVLDGVVRQQVAELGGELRRERLVVRHHEGRALHLLDEPGGRRRLAGSGRAEQHDIGLARVDAVRELFDRGRLIAARDVVADHLEGADRAGGLHTLQATRRRRQRAGAARPTARRPGRASRRACRPTRSRGRRGRGAPLR